MFNRVKNALYNAVSGLDVLNDNEQSASSGSQLKFPYSRPLFLQLNTADEIQVSADHAIRPIIVPRDITKLPWNVGYAEAVNAGKSSRNEDQASIQIVTLRRHAATQHNLFSSQSSEASQNLIGFRKLFRNNSLHSTTVQTQTSAEYEKQSSSSTERINGKSNQDYIKRVNGEVEDGSSTSVEYATPPSTPDSDRKPASEGMSSEIPSNTEKDVSSLDISISQSISSDLCSPEPAEKCTATHCIPYVYFGLFDGHAGSGAAVVASRELHLIIQEKLMNIINLLLPNEDGTNRNEQSVIKKSRSLSWNIEKEVTTDSLIIGALESAFVEMDQRIATDRFKYKISGGCTSLIVLFIFGKIFVANAGDSRSVLCKDGEAIPMSHDFTPETEKERVRNLGKLQPHLLGSDFTQLEFIRRPIRSDIGRKLLYQDAFMTGWAYKTVTAEDLKFPLVFGEGKRSRVLATIGVTRGFGDHDLKAQNSDLLIKPFLTPEPEVRMFDLMSNDVTENDVLIMGTDGLWDVTSNVKATEVVQKSLNHFPSSDKVRGQIRYTSAAQDLVMQSRGKLRVRNWRTADETAATIDDISVFVIPLLPYKYEFQLFIEENDWIKSKL